LSAYSGNRDEAVEGAIEADPIAGTVRALMETRTEWTGTVSELLGALAEQAGERIAQSKTWPATPRGLSGWLRRVAPVLRHANIHVRSMPRRGRARPIMITCGAIGAPQNGEAFDRHHRHHSHPAANICGLAGESRGDGRVQPGDDRVRPGDGRPDATVTGVDTRMARQSNGIASRGDGGDGSDGQIHGDSPRRCDHCGASASPGDPLTSWDWPDRPDGIWLHSRCEVGWFDTAA
jgi:hypothetical protein